MTLDQLRVFVAVAERQHMTRAAEALGMAQSAVSAAVASLEGRHGSKLFHRLGRGVTLTDAGTLFLSEAKAVLARAAAAELALAELGGLKRGTLAVQASQTIAGYWLPHHLVAFQRAYPGIEIRLGIGNTAQVARAVHDGEAELGFVEGRVDDPLLLSRVVARDQLMVVVAPGHPWADTPPATPEDLAESVWVLREPGSGTRAAFEDVVREGGVLETLQVALAMPSNEAVRGAVEAGLGATALSASVVAASIEAGLLCAVAFALPDREFHVLRHRDRYRSRAAEALIASVTDRQGRS